MITARTGREEVTGIFDTIDRDGNLVLITGTGPRAIPAAEYFSKKGGGPMLLAIDCGNTNTVFSIWDGNGFIATWRTTTEWQRTADQYYVWLSTLMRFQNVDVMIDEVIVTSTVPRVVFNLRVFATAISIAARWWWASPNACCPQRRASMQARKWGRTGWSIPPGPLTGMAAT